MMGCVAVMEDMNEGIIKWIEESEIKWIEEKRMRINQSKKERLKRRWQKKRQSRRDNSKRQIQRFNINQLIQKAQRIPRANNSPPLTASSHCTKTVTRLPSIHPLRFTISIYFSYPPLSYPRENYLISRKISHRDHSQLAIYQASNQPQQKKFYLIWFVCCFQLFNRLFSEVFTLFILILNPLSIYFYTINHMHHHFNHSYSCKLKLPHLPLHCLEIQRTCSTTMKSLKRSLVIVLVFLVVITVTDVSITVVV